MIVEPIAGLVDPEVGARCERFSVSDHVTGKLASSRALEPVRTILTTRGREF